MGRHRKPKPHDSYRDIVQIDVDDAIEERRDDRGRRRYSLNDTERTILKERQKIAAALALMVEKGLTVPAIAEQIDFPTSEMNAAIMGETYPEFRQAALQRVAQMFLDVDTNHTRREIAEAVGISMEQLRAITQSEDFEKIYNAHFQTLDADPIIKAVQQKVVEDLLPRAYITLRDILDDSEGSQSVRLKAALEVMQRAGVRKVDAQVSDRQELAKFLAERNVQIDNMTVNIIPPEYQQAVEEIIEVSPTASLLGDVEEDNAE